MRWLAFILCLLLLAVKAQAQAQFPLPATSSTQAEVNLGDVQFILDSDPGFQLDYPIQITPSGEDGVFMKGTIKTIDTGSGQTLLTVHVTRAVGGGIFTNWNLLVTSAPDVSVSTGTAFSSTGNGATSLGMKMTLGNPGAFPYSSGALGVGSIMSFTVPANQNFPVDSHLKVDDYSNPNNHYHVKVKAYSGTTLTAVITSAFGTGVPSSAWRISGLVGPQTRITPFGISGLQVVQSGTTATLNINAGCVRDSGDTIDLCLAANTTLDLSSSSSIVTVQGPGTTTTFGGGITTLVGSSTTFTTSFSTAGTLTDLTNQTTALGLAAITARSIVWDGVSVTTNISAIANDTHATLGQAVSGTTGAYYRGGPVSHTGSLNLELDYGIILAYQASTGTVKPFGVSFTQNGAIDLPSGYTYYRVIAAVGIYYNGSNYSVQNIKQPLMPLNIGQVVAGVAASSIGSANPAAYVLGMTALPTPALTYYGALATFGGRTDFVFVSKSGVISFDRVDLAGSMVTGTLGTANGGTGATSLGSNLTNSGSVLNTTPNSLLPTAVYFATITPTTISGSVSSVNTGTGVITWSTNHGLTTGQCIRGVGTVPTGFTVGQMFYMNALSSNTFALYTTLANALADTSRVTLSSSTTGATVVDLVYSNVFSVGFSSVAPVCGTPGGTTMQFDYNITNALATTAGAVSTNLYNLVETGGTAGVPWLVTPNYTFTSTTLVKAPSTIMRNTATNNGPGTWAQQSTNAFNISVWIWGALDDPIPANDNDLIERAVA